MRFAGFKEAGTRRAEELAGPLHPLVRYWLKTSGDPIMRFYRLAGYRPLPYFCVGQFLIPAITELCCNLDARSAKAHR